MSSDLGNFAARFERLEGLGRIEWVAIYHGFAAVRKQTTSRERKFLIFEDLHSVHIGNKVINLHATRASRRMGVSIGHPRQFFRDVIPAARENPAPPI